MKKHRFVTFFVLIVVAYTGMYTQCDKDYGCLYPECEKISVVLQQVQKQPNVLYTAQADMSLITIRVKDLRNYNWQPLADTTCALIKRSGAQARYRIGILSILNDKDTLVKQVCN